MGAGIDAVTVNRDYGFTHTLKANNNSRSYSNQYDLFAGATTAYRSSGAVASAQTVAMVNEANAAEVDPNAELSNVANAGHIIDLTGNAILSTTTDTVTTISGDVDDPMMYVDGK